MSYNQDLKDIIDYGPNLKSKKQTKKLCLAAVTIEGLNLAFVRNKTEEICIAALKQNGMALFYINNPTREMCIIAVNQTKKALNYAKASFKDIEG